jgi:hypothetical protein
VVIHTARLQLPYERHDDDLCALLRWGKNVITIAGHHYPATRGPATRGPARLAMFDEAARAGRATLYGTGMNPGYVLERLVLGLTGVCTEVRRIEVTELLNAATMPDPDFVFTVMGMGSDPDRLNLRAGPLAELYGKLYAEAITFLADRMHVPLDGIEPDHTVVPAARDLEVSAGASRPGRSRRPNGGGMRYRPVSGSSRCRSSGPWTRTWTATRAATTGRWNSRAGPTCTCPWTCPTRRGPACAPRPGST